MYKNHLETNITTVIINVIYFSKHLINKLWEIHCVHFWRLAVKTVVMTIIKICVDRAVFLSLIISKDALKDTCVTNKSKDSYKGEVLSI